MYQEKKEEKDLPASKTALTHPHDDSKITQKNTNEDWLRPSETILTKTKKQKWEGKQLHGRFKRLINNISHDKTWTWLRKGNFKRETEYILMAAQNSAIRTNHIKVRIDKTQQNSKCRLSGDRDEIINHIISECSKLAQKEYKAWHDWVGKVIHWEMCKKFKFDHANKWYMYNPASVLENDTQNPMGLWYTYGSPNLGQKIRPYNNQQNKKENLQNWRLCCSGWPQNKTERMWKER